MTEVEDLNQHLSALMQETFNILNGQEKSFQDELKLLFGSFLSTRAYEHQKVIDENIFDDEPNTSPVSVWAKVGKYCHLLYYGLLIFIISKIGTANLKQRLSEFMTTMNKFASGSKLSNDLFSKLRSAAIDLRPELTSDAPKIVVVITDRANELSLVHTYHLTRILIDKVSMPFIVGPHLARCDGGYTMTWLVPPSCTSLLKWKLSCTEPKFFVDNRIHAIQVEGTLCYLTKINKCDPAREIALVTTVSAERFELEDLMKVALNSSPPVTLTQICTAYTCKLLTEYLSDLPSFGAKRLQIRSLGDLPQAISEQLCNLGKLAYEDIIKSCSNDTMLVRFPLEINGLGLMNTSSPVSKDGNCYQTILHPTLQQYLIAYYIYLQSTFSPSEVKVLNLGYIPYFYSGLKQSILFLQEVNTSLMLFEANTPHVVETFFAKMRVTGQAVTLNMTTTENLMKVLLDLLTRAEITSESSSSSVGGNQTASKSSTSQRRYLQPHSTSELSQIFSSYIVGRLLSYSNCKWKLCGCLNEGFVQGLIASTELYSGLFTPSKQHELELYIKITSETDLQLSSCLPFCILRRTKHIEIMNLSISSNVIQALQSLSFISGGSNMQLSLIKCMIDKPSLSGCLHQVITSLDFLDGLELDSCFLSDGIGTALALLLKQSKCLTFLRVNCKTIMSEADTRSVISGIGESKSLTKLAITETLSIENAQLLFAVLQNNPCKIAQIDISWCNVSVYSISLLEKYLSVSNSLTHLNMYGNSLDSHGVPFLCEGLKLNKSLKVLNLGLNTIEDEGACHLAEVIAMSRCLESLYLTKNCIGHRGTSVLAKVMSGNISLKVLDLGENLIGDNGACALAQMLVRNEVLEDLNIERNYIGHVGTLILANVLHVNKTLKVLNLNGNNVQDEGAKALAAMIWKNKSLRILKLEKSSIGHRGHKLLTAALTITQREVHLSHNLEL